MKKSIVAGIFIGLGGTAFLSVDNKILGALLFSLGLLSICVTDQSLFTGKVSYVNNPLYLIEVLVGNFIGASGMGLVIRYLKPGLCEKALTICENKLKEGDKVILLGALCNILIFIAIEGYKKQCYYLLILAVMCFILCGFEHSIANMFYFSVAYGKDMFFCKYLLLNILGNAIGGIFAILIQLEIKFND